MQQTGCNKGKHFFYTNLLEWEQWQQLTILNGLLEKQRDCNCILWSEFTPQLCVKKNRKRKIRRKSPFFFLLKYLGTQEAPWVGCWNTQSLLLSTFLKELFVNLQHLLLYILL